MHKGILAFRYTVLIIIVCAMIIFIAKWSYFYWQWINYEPDALSLVATDDVVFNAGNHKVNLPKGIILYPVDEREIHNKYYPGGQYKIYVSLEDNISDFNAVAWTKDMTNVVNRLQK